MARPPLELSLLGPIEVRRGGQTLALPASKKTRALLGYLALTGRAHRRERLCELFWDVADDPRAGLRWSLSKLRGVVDDDDHARLRADKDGIGLSRDNLRIDVVELRQRASSIDTLSREELEQLERQLQDELLLGLDLPDLFAFQAWLAAERGELRALRTRILWQLVERLADDPIAAAEHARSLVAIDPTSERAHAALVRALLRAGRSSEAEQAQRAGVERLKRAGKMPVGALLDAAAELRGASPPPAVSAKAIDQEIRFCRTSDGVRIAYAISGEGTPVVKTSHWMSHLEAEPTSRVFGPMHRELTRRHRLLRFDQRGTGLSDRNVESFAVDDFVRDLEAVVDDAGLERFALFAVSQGASSAIAFAVKHPARVSRLVIYGGFASGWKHDATPKRIERMQALRTLIRHGWGSENPAFRQTFTSLFIPKGTLEQMSWYNELQRVATSPEIAARLFDSLGSHDVRDLLPQLSVPTLVLHARGDAVVGFEAGRRMAAAIPGARFVPLDSDNHILLDDEPAWRALIDQLFEFLG